MKVLNIVFLVTLIGLGYLLSSCDAVDRHMSQGYEFVIQGKYEDAITKYQQVLKVEPNHVRANYNLGLIYSMQGKYEDAIDTYQKVIDLSSDDGVGNNWTAYSYLNLGDIYKKQGKLDDAIDRFQQAIAVAPNQAWVHISQAMIHLTQSRPDDAITEYQKAIKGQPNNAGIYYGLTRAYSLKNEKEVSIQWLQKAVKLDKSFIEWSKTDSDLDNIRQFSSFQQLINSK